MIDFTELPEDGIKFEQLIREILVLEGFETHWTGVGPDGGRDLIIIENLKGDLSEYQRKWLVSCKHYANSKKSVGIENAGNITGDCTAIGAEGYIMVCSTQPSASLVTRLKEIEQNQKLITKYWDSIEIEKRLLKPNTFGLIHTFFPKSSKNYQWRIYNAFSPAFWAAHYKGYFFYLSCRLSNTYPPLLTIEAIVFMMEKLPIYKDKNSGWNSHHIRLRAVYYDDKYTNHVAYLDYIYPRDADKTTILNPKQLDQLLTASFKDVDASMNLPEWDVLYIEDSIGSDSFELDHKKYYEPHMLAVESGTARKAFLHSLVYDFEMRTNQF